MNIFITFICLTFSFSLQASGIDNTLQQSKQFLANIHTLSDKIKHLMRIMYLFKLKRLNKLLKIRAIQRR